MEVDTRFADPPPMKSYQTLELVPVDYQAAEVDVVLTRTEYLL